MIWWVVWLSLFLASWAWVRFKVSSMGILTYKSFISSVRSLCWVLMCSFTSSLARQLELVVL